MSKNLFCGLLLVLLVSGCKETQQPLAGRCVVDPQRIDFGSVLPPQSSQFEEDVTREITLSNLPDRTSPSGNEDVTGTILLIVDAPQANPPDFHLIPRNMDPRFKIPARESLTFEIEATILSSTSSGPYVGTVDVGSFCTAVAFTLHVSARPEEPPPYILEWGTKGAANGQFQFPVSLAASPGGDVYVLDRENKRVQQFDEEGNYVRQWFEWDELDRDPGLTTFKSPVGIAVDNQGNVYVSDIEPGHDTARVTQFDGDGNYLLHWGRRQGDTSVVFGRAWHLDVDGEGHIFVLDTQAFTIQKFLLQPGTSPGYQILETWGSRGTTNGRFILPYGLAVDRRNGDVYVTDSFRNNVQKFSGDGRFLLQWGGSGSGPSQFNEAAGVAVDASGNVYVADNANRRVQKFDENGAFLTEWGIPGSQPGQFLDPLDVTVDGQGAIFVVDSNTHRVLKFIAGASQVTTSVENGP